MWGDGEQTRSFCLVDDCIEGLMRLMHSDVTEPINLGSTEMISMNDLQQLALSLRQDSGRGITIRHVDGPQGVRGRNSDNTLVKAVLDGWEPSTPLAVGLRRTFEWIAAQVAAEKAEGIDTRRYIESNVVAQSTDSLAALGCDSMSAAAQCHQGPPSK